MPRKVITARVAVDERRPAPQSRYEARFINSAAVMAQHGMTDREIARALGVCHRTFKFWLVAHPKLKAAMLIPKEIADARVEASLYQRANGYDVEDEEVKVINGEIVKVTVRRHIPIDTVAALAWLNNRRRDHWSRNPEPYIETPQIEHMADDDITPANAREAARRVALMMYRGVKLNS